MKAILIARVSTEEQKEAGNSLPAQVMRLERYCQNKGFTVIKTCSFGESAYSDNMEKFMLKNNNQLNKLFIVSFIFSCLLFTNIAYAMASDINQQLLDNIKHERFIKAIDLLNLGADPNTKTAYGSAFLDALNATRYVSKQDLRTQLNDLIKTFVNKGADIHQQKFDQSTPLFFAYSLDAARALVEAGADITHKNMFGRAAIETFSGEAHGNEFFEKESKAVTDYLSSIKPQKLS